MNKYLIALNSQLPEGFAATALNFELTPADELPERIVLVPAGQIVIGRDGRQWRNPDPQRIVDTMKARNVDVVFDFEHASELKAPQGDKAPAAAWLDDFAVEDGQVTARIKLWTPDGETAVRSKEYRYYSPVIIYHRSTFEISRISSVGLTNKPNLELAALNSEQHLTEEDMNKNILAKLGLDETATEQQVLTAIATLQSDLASARNAEQTPSLAKFVPRSDYDQMEQRAMNAEQLIADNQKAQLKEARDEAINAALEAGKIAPASKDYYVAMCHDQSGLDQFNEFVKTAPQIAAPSNLDRQKPDGEGKSLNAEEQEICGNLGISTEDYLSVE